MIYFLQDSGKLYVKIGFTDKDDPESRKKMLQTGNGSPLVLLAFVEGTRDDEQRLHNRFAVAREVGEWFRPTPELIRHIVSAQCEAASAGMFQQGRSEGYAKGVQTANELASDPESILLHKDRPKPLPWPLTIYLAGKIGKNCWRHDIVGGLASAITAKCPSETIEDGEIGVAWSDADTLRSFRWPLLRESIFDGHHYSGPFFVGCTGEAYCCGGEGHCAVCNKPVGYECSCDCAFCSQGRHEACKQRTGSEWSCFPVFKQELCERDYPCHTGGCYHGDDTHGMKANGVAVYNQKPHDMEAVANTVSRLCLAAIHQADLVFAWIDSPDCFGTIAELGYARALRKTIWIAGPRKYRDMWFVYEMAERTMFTEQQCDTIGPADVLQNFLAGVSQKVTTTPK